MKIDALTLADGSTLISVESKAPGPAHGGVLVHLGSSDDPDHLRGRSHVLEHLISARQQRSVKLTGAATRRDSMVFSATAGAGADLLAFFASLRHVDARGLIENFSEQRKIVLREIEQTRPENGRGDVVSVGIAAILGADSPYRHPPAGTLDHVRDLRPEHALEAVRLLEEAPPPVLVVFHAAADRRQLLSRLRSEGARQWRPLSARSSAHVPPPPTARVDGRTSRFHAFVRLPTALRDTPTWAAGVATGHAVASDELGDLRAALLSVGVPVSDLRFASYPMWRNDSVGHFSFALAGGVQTLPEPGSFTCAMRHALAATDRRQVWSAHERTRRLRAFRDPLAAFELVRSSYLGQSSVGEFATVETDNARAASMLLQQVCVPEHRK